MALKLYRTKKYVKLEDTGTGEIKEYPAKDLRYREDGANAITFIRISSGSTSTGVILWSDLVDENLNPWPSKAALLDWLDENTGGEIEIDVSIQDQHTPVIIAKMSSVENETTLAQATAVDDTTIEVADATGFVIGKYISIFSLADERFFLANVLGVAGTTITVDTPLDHAYSIGDFVTSGFDNMAVDGDTTTQVFGLRNTDQAIGKSYDITRMIFVCLTSGSVDLSKFGDIAGGLAKGIVIRKKDGDYRTILNAKTNADLKSFMYDFDIQQASGNQQDGFVGRLTFAGQSKIGVTIRLAPGEDLQLLVQDDISSLTYFGIVIEGHEVE